MKCLSGEMLANKPVVDKFVNRVGVPPVGGTDHQSEGIMCASARRMPSNLSIQVGEEVCCGLSALKMMEPSSGEKTGSSIISGIHEPVSTISCAPIPSESATNI